MSEYTNISKLENYLQVTLKGNVTKNTFVGTLPDTIKTTWDDMVLIDCDSGLRDYDAYGKGIVNIFLYARPHSNGTKNVAVMDKLEEALDEVIKADSSDQFHLFKERVFSDYDSVRNWHCNVVLLGIISK